MQRSMRMIDPTPKLQSLVEVRQDVQQRIERLAKRAHLTPAEAEEEKRLKHVRVSVQDRIDHLARRD